MTFNIGDSVFCATSGTTQIWIECPECLGSGRLRVIIGTGEEFSIGCTCCERGYEGSPGRISTYDYQAKTESHTITGIEVQQHEGKLKTTYRTYNYYLDEANVFATKDEAIARAQQLAQEHAENEQRQLKCKEKDTRSWAWNVTYHRRCIKEAHRQIAYHTSKLHAAPHTTKASKQPLVETTP